MAISAGVAVAVGVGAQGYFGNKSSKKAARAAREAAERLRQAKIRAVSYQTPYEASGRTGLNALTGLLTGQQSDQKGNLSTLSSEDRAALFQKSPGYQFRLNQAQEALEASQAARRGLLSGGAARELSQFTQGIASDEYGSYINQLQGLSNIGQGAANTISNIEIGAGSQMANYAQQAGMAMANRDANLGNAIAGGASAFAGLAGRQAGASQAARTGSGGGAGGPGVFSNYNMPGTTLTSNY